MMRACSPREGDDLEEIGDTDVLDFLMLAKQATMKQYCFKRQAEHFDELPTSQSVHDNPNSIEQDMIDCQKSRSFPNDALLTFPVSK